MDNSLNLNINTTANRKNFESFNILSENGDSIYSPLFEQSTIEEKGQIFISKDIIVDLINIEVEKRVGASNRNDG